MRSSTMFTAKSTMVSLLLLLAGLASVPTRAGETAPGARADTAAHAVALAKKAGLGRQLFMDENLSEPPGMACVSCHSLSSAFSDARQKRPTSEGSIPVLFGKRNAPSAMYAAFSPAFHYDETEKVYVGGQFLDGRAASLEEQAKGPLLSPLEMGNTSKHQVIAKVRSAAYADAFKEVFGPSSLDDPEIAFDRIAIAIAAFERTSEFNRFTSKYDAYLAGKVRLSAQELRGLKLFEDKKKGNCAACHPSRPDERGAAPLFTDFTYDNLGVPKNPANDFYWMPGQFNPDGRKFVDKGLGAVLQRETENGKFKVPTLRNVALTAPYMHNGYFQTLRGAVEFYNSRDRRSRCAKAAVSEADAHKQRCWPEPEEPDNVNDEELGRLGLNAREVDDIVAFLHTLTDGWSVTQR